MANPQHGSVAVFKLDDGSDTLQDLSSYLTSAGLTEAVDEAEVTHLGDVSKEFIVGLSSATIPLAGNLDATVDGQLAGIKRKVVDWEYYPFGDSGGVGTNVKYNGTCFFTQYDKSNPVGGVATLAVTLRVTGDVTRSLV